MKRLSIILSLFLIAFVLVNCEKEDIDTSIEGIDKKVEARSSRISFIKSGKAVSDDKQQDFKLLYISTQSDTKIGFLVEYKTGDDYKLHDFDVTWDEKIDADSEGKLWMNLKVYHKTYEENAKNVMQDSAVVNIPDISKFSNDTITKLWLRFINTTDTENILTLQYQKSGSSDNSSSEDEETGESTAQDSTSANGNNSGTTQDSTYTNYNGGDNDTGTTVQDSTNTSD